MFTHSIRRKITRGCTLNYRGVVEVIFKTEFPLNVIRFNSSDLIISRWPYLKL
jgi:hypothetical protein